MQFNDPPNKNDPRARFFASLARLVGAGVGQGRGAPARGGAATGARPGTKGCNCSGTRRTR